MLENPKPGILNSNIKVYIDPHADELPLVMGYKGDCWDRCNNCHSLKLSEAQMDTWSGIWT